GGQWRGGEAPETLAADSADSDGPARDATAAAPPSATKPEAKQAGGSPHRRKTTAATTENATDGTADERPSRSSYRGDGGDRPRRRYRRRHCGRTTTNASRTRRRRPADCRNRNGRRRGR